MTSASSDEALHDTHTMTVTITGEGPDGYTYTTSPESITFRSKKHARVLKCEIVNGKIPGNFVFSGFNYPVANVQVDAHDAGTSTMALTFQFNGQKTGGSLLFYIIDDDGNIVIVDPQVGNDPEPGL